MVSQVQRAVSMGHTFLRFSSHRNRRRFARHALSSLLMTTVCIAAFASAEAQVRYNRNALPSVEVNLDVLDNLRDGGMAAEHDHGVRKRRLDKGLDGFPNRDDICSFIEVAVSRRKRDAGGKK